MPDTDETTSGIEPSADTWQKLADATAAAIENEQPANAEEESAEEDDTDEGNTGSRREARYRVQLREAEAERDQLRANVEAMQRAEVERLAAKSIQKPSALWSTDVQLSDMLGENGAVDPAKVEVAVRTARDELGLAATKPPGYVASEGSTVGRSAASDPWQELFKG